VTQWVKALFCKPEGRGFDWNFLLTQPFSSIMTLRSRQALTAMSTRNSFWGIKGGRGIRPKTLPSSCANYLEIWDPRSSGTLRAYQACTGMDFPFFFHILIFFTNPCINLPYDLFPSSMPTKILYSSFCSPTTNTYPICHKVLTRSS